MGKINDLTGQKFGRLLALKIVGTDKNRRKLWECKCDCGETAIVSSLSLKSENTKSCGCYKIEQNIKNATKHGFCKNPIFKSWRSMIYRCENKSNTNYHNYGGRGIKVCERWKDFEKFSQDMLDSYKPGLTLDRINNDGDYEPDNCRWVTRKSQSLNRRTSRIISTPKGKMTTAEAGEEFGINQDTIRDRINRGWTEFDACLIPSQKRKKNSS